MKNLRILFAIAFCTALFNSCTAESIQDEQKPTVEVVDGIDIDYTGEEEATHTDEDEEHND